MSKTDQTASNSHPAAAPIAWASQSNGAATRDAAPSPTASQTEEITGTSHTPITNTSTLDDDRRGQTDWPTFQKKLMSVTLAPQITAAPQETRTPIFPREARCGFDEFAPMRTHRPLPRSASG